MDDLFSGLVVLVALFALGKWREAIFACLLIDATRDFFRKISEQQSVLTTLTIGLVWMAALFGAFTLNGRECRSLFLRYPQYKKSVLALVAALVPGALISTLMYQNGWVLAVVGILSYLCPGIGIVLGYLWPRRADDIYKWLSAYVLINAVVLIGVILEIGKVKFPGLGGMNMVWIRYNGTDIVQLIAGFYRSPDVMGLHAAHVILFGAIIALRPRQRFTWFWLLICTWGATCVLLSGRRKMIGMPAVFLVSYVGLVTSSSGRIRFAVGMAGAAVVIVGMLSLIIETQDISSDYTRFASTIMGDVFERTSESFSSAVAVTLQQSGLLGDGLGVATQGRHRLGIVTNTRDWQEDGVGRLFKELGVPGVVLAVVSLYFLIAAVRHSMTAIPKGHPAQSLQFGIYSVVFANACGFIVSHQAYSGDPSTILMIGFCLGMGLGIPRTVWSNVSRPVSPKRPVTLTEFPSAPPDSRQEIEDGKEVPAP